MLREHFVGRNPSHFQFNPVVKAFIVSEAFLFSAYNLVIPIFAVFVIRDIEGGNIQIAASAFSLFLITRVVFELIICKCLSGRKEKSKFLATIIGMGLISASYLGFSFAHSIYLLFAFYGLAGIGFGIASPLKNAIFSTHLDKNKEATEWGIRDAVTFIGMASTAALGGFIASQYGFSFLFILAALINFLAIIPYLLYVSPKA